MEIRSYNWEAIWANEEVHCPICSKKFSGWYCPSCGLPKKNSKYAVNKQGNLLNCDKYHFRPEFASFKKFQLCDECYITNPSDAKYCRNCGKELSSSKGISQEAHGWVDLGLSVLWATETIEGLYMWNYAEELHHFTNMEFYRGQESRELEDVATKKWGKKWRTPTKEEFEELVIKCKWEKCLTPNSYKYALKIIGPNGNSIIIPVTGEAGCDRSKSENFIVQLFAFWTSTRNEKQGTHSAYAFCYEEFYEFHRTLTIKEREELAYRMEFFRGKEEDLLIHAQRCKERQLLMSKEEVRKVDEDNMKKDEERKRKLWLDKPVDLHINEEKIVLNTIKPRSMNRGFAILPVADKKWIGKL